MDFKDPRLVKRDLKNWRRRLGAATDAHIPVSYYFTHFKGENYTSDLVISLFLFFREENGLLHLSLFLTFHLPSRDFLGDFRIDIQTYFLRLLCIII